MRAVITNKLTIIEDPSKEVESFLSEQLSYKDKAKEYQARRMAKNPFLRNSPQYLQVLAESKGTLLRAHPTRNCLIIPTGLEYLIRDFNIPTVDQRKLTGSTVALPWANKPYDPRDYQEEAIVAIENGYRGIINFATGLGKTLVATHAVKRCRTKSLIICPTDSIAKQFYEQFEKAFGKKNLGFYGGGKKKLNDITIGIAASVYKDADKFAAYNFGLVIVDEVHHIAASTFYDIAQKLGDVGKMFGLTATDYRQDGKDIMISAGCGEVLMRRDIPWGVANGWLAQPVCVVRKVPTKGRDFKDDKLKSYKEHVLNNQLMKDQILNDIKQCVAQGKSFLCLVDEVAHGEELANLLGVPFATGRDKQSQEYVEQLNKGSIPGLIGTDGKVGEGTDTQRVDVLIMANFAAGKGPVVQAVGRGLRLYGNKKSCLILDYIPEGSTMMTRHAMGRIKIYEDIGAKVAVI